ncbi:hypothetical protein [Mycobacterium sp. E1747]|uniref:hypothetical protein n=1 Tax=Mycobacterium sp. E1747 TaxID=1834128 RepID=UPI0007FD5812|nr:hypothetical protein [Mycobacterium sp. E1747]OBH08907.1 hypothetical protein A5695_25355 [Mycobacterium sp. E1747]
MIYLLITAAVLYIFIAIAVASLMIKFDHESWTDNEGRISDFDSLTSIIFGIVCGVAWPITVLALAGAALAESKPPTT